MQISRRDAAAGLAAMMALPGAARADEGVWSTLRTEPYRGKQDDLSVLEGGMTAWYGNGAGKLFRTDDGGDVWTKVWDQPGTFVRALGFLNADVGFLGNVGTDYYPGVTDPWPLYRTGDGGRTFQRVEGEGMARVKGICAIDIRPTRRIYQGEMRDSAVIHAAGRVGGPAWLCRSDDAGATWRVQDLSAVAGMILDVHFLDATTGFICAGSSPDVEQSEAMILRTTDGAKTWRPVWRGNRKFENCWKMSFPSRRVGYATIQSYDDSNPRRLVLKTQDGGRRWKELDLTSDPNTREFGIGFANEKRGWVGTRVRGYETRDGGRSWRAVENLGQAVNKVRVVKHGEGQRIFAVGVGVARLDLAG